MTINDYIINHTEKEDSVLEELNRETHLKILRPRMLSGHYQGKLIEFFSKMIKPKKILEIGTYTGYSTICWAKGLQKNGIIHTIDINDELEPIILKYFKKAKIENKVKLHFGDATKIIPEINEVFDIVFIDADKPNYLNYYNLVFDKIKKGGYIIADNVLWDGKVIQETDKKDESTKAIKEFNDFAHNDERVENIILNIRDGLMIIRKK
ncbi:MAG: O-methyltransferase [Chlorobi bacterium]|nr:O-methyltransferase [Chlorobiota bacterium]